MLESTLEITFSPPLISSAELKYKFDVTLSSNFALTLTMKLALPPIRLMNPH